MSSNSYDKTVTRASVDIACVAIEHAATMMTDAELAGSDARSGLLRQAAALLAFALADFTKRHSPGVPYTQQRDAALKAVAVFFDGPPQAMSRGGNA